MGGFTLTIQVQGGEALLQADPAEIVRRIGLAVTRQMAETTHAAVAPRVPVDTGALLGSGEVVETADGAVLQFTMPYAAGVEHGTPPHQEDYGPGSPLAGWAKRHNIPPAVIGRHIAELGTAEHPYMQPGLEAAREGFPQMTQDAAAALRAALTGGGS